MRRTVDSKHTDCTSNKRDNLKGHLHRVRERLILHALNFCFPPICVFLFEFYFRLSFPNAHIEIDDIRGMNKSTEEVDVVSSMDECQKSAAPRSHRSNKFNDFNLSMECGTVQRCMHISRETNWTGKDEARMLDGNFE